MRQRTLLIPVLLALPPALTSTVRAVEPTGPATEVPPAPTAADAPQRWYGWQALMVDLSRLRRGGATFGIGGTF